MLQVQEDPETLKRIQAILDNYNNQGIGTNLFSFLYFVFFLIFLIQVFIRNISQKMYELKSKIKKLLIYK